MRISFLSVLFILEVDFEMIGKDYENNFRGSVKEIFRPRPSSFHNTDSDEEDICSVFIFKSAECQLHDTSTISFIVKIRSVG